MLLTIEEIKKMPPDSECLAPTLKAVVMDVSPVEKNNKDVKSKFFAILADKTTSISATIYNENHFKKFIKGMGVVLINVLLKQAYIGVTARTEVAICNAFEIPEEVKSTVLQLPGHQSTTLQSAMDSPEKSIISVKGRITKVSPATTKQVKGNSVPFQELVLKDSTSKVTVAVWEDMVNKVENKQLIKLTNCRVRLFNDEKKLSTTPSSNLEVLPDDSNEANFDVSSDEDNDDEAADMQMPVGSITALFEADPYLACPKVSCSNTKLITLKEEGVESYYMSCKNCHGRYKAGNTKIYLRVTALLEGDNFAKKVTLFAPQVHKMFEARGLDSTIPFDREEMMNKFMSIVPCEIRYTMVNNTIRNLICKRPNTQ